MRIVNVISTSVVASLLALSATSVMANDKAAEVAKEEKPAALLADAANVAKEEKPAALLADATNVAKEEKPAALVA